MYHARAGFIDEGTRAVWLLLEAAACGLAPGAPVRFVADPPFQRGAVSVLEVQHDDAFGAMAEVRRALFHLRIQVVREAAAEGRPVVVLDLAEFDGARLGPRRREQVREILTDLLSHRPLDAP